MLSGALSSVVSICSGFVCGQICGRDRITVQWLVRSSQRRYCSLGNTDSLQMAGRVFIGNHSTTVRTQKTKKKHIEIKTLSVMHITYCSLVRFCRTDWKIIGLV